MTPAGSRFPVVVHHCLGLPGPVLQAIADDRVFVGHNLTEFDYHVWRHKIHPLPRRWYDTLFTARAAGLPGKLDDLGKRLTGRGKDEGQAILRKIMRQPDRPPKPGDVCPPTQNSCSIIGRIDRSKLRLLATAAMPQRRGANVERVEPVVEWTRRAGRRAA